MLRVTQVQGRRAGTPAVLAYNTECEISLSKSARISFCGRQGTGDMRQFVCTPRAWLDHTRPPELFDLFRRLSQIAGQDFVGVLSQHGWRLVLHR